MADSIVPIALPITFSKVCEVVNQDLLGTNGRHLFGAGGQFDIATGTFDPTYVGVKDRLSNFRGYQNIIYTYPSLLNVYGFNSESNKSLSVGLGGTLLFVVASTDVGDLSASTITGIGLTFTKISYGVQQVVFYADISLNGGTSVVFINTPETYVILGSFTLTNCSTSIGATVFNHVVADNMSTNISTTAPYSLILNIFSSNYSYVDPDGTLISKYESTILPWGSLSSAYYQKATIGSVGLYNTAVGGGAAENLETHLIEIKAL